jgi:hypothetical protein
MAGNVKAIKDAAVDLKPAQYPELLRQSRHNRAMDGMNPDITRQPAGPNTICN